MKNFKVMINNFLLFSGVYFNIISDHLNKQPIIRKIVVYFYFI